MSKPNKPQTRADLISLEINPKDKENASPENFIQRIIAASYRSVEL